MKIFKIILIFTVIPAFAVFASSCKSGKEQIVYGMVKEVAHFPKIKNVNAELDIVSPLRTFLLGEPALIVFRLTNFSDKRLVVYEWMMIDEYNIRLYVTPWADGEPIPPADKWICLKPEIKNKRLMTLDLGQNNATMVDKTIDFKKDIINGEIDKPKTFLVYGELNLESISLKTSPTKITILPQLAP
ncbi:MAG TPA: hypothetical protein DET40_21450 [Lentisphaeria bacterium]|nr:MAG: hypothetical protein A2X45_03360 [Lentisphaerae bacterium GWF2_50_93]HCE46118.1 hypothetical protein [Lentisphaeria bacterium]